jgi:prepilin-type N-terminal cleavage/methylation domain-containing protein
MKNKKGFTLIELLIVIAIITILAAAIIVGINPARHFAAARNATRWSQMNTIATAIYSYAVEHGGAFPTDPEEPTEYCIGPEGSPADIIMDSTDPNCTDPTADPPCCWCCDTAGVSLLIPDYIHALPVPPLADEVYQIQLEGEAIKITSSATEAADIILIQ